MLTLNIYSSMLFKLFPKSGLKCFSRSLSGERVVQSIKSDDVKFDLFQNRIESWQFHSYGDLNELQKSYSRIPFLRSSSEVLVKVKAVSLNPLDLMMISGYARNVSRFLSNYEIELPVTLGRDFCGTIINKGQDVYEHDLGDEVYGVIPIQKEGSLSEVILADHSLVCKKPEDLSALEAASIPYAGMTAWSALYFSRSFDSIIPNKTKILILGASGGVGTLAVQMLKAKSAIVVATCSSDAISLVQSLGASVAYDYTDIHFNQNVQSNGPYEVILDCAKFGHNNIPPEWSYKNYIALNGPLVSNTDKYGMVGGLAWSASNLFLENITKCSQGSTIKWGFFTPCPSGLQFIDNLVRRKQVRPVIHKIFKFDEVPQAFETLKRGHTRGKIVIDFK